MAIRYNNDICVIHETQQRMQGRQSGWVQLVARNLRTGKSTNMRYGSTDKVETIPLHRTKLEFSYKDQHDYYFMDPETYETVSVNEELLGDSVDYLIENLIVDVVYSEGRPVMVDLPASVDLKVTEAPEAVRGDTVNNVQKTVTLETGKVIQAPMFIKEGETIKVDTRNGTYIGRA